VPNYRPPEALTGTPGKVTLARGTRLKREPAERTVVLFGDRSPAGALRAEEEDTVDFDTAEGREWLDSVLRPYYVQLAP